MSRDRERQVVYLKEYYQTNREKLLARSKEYRKAHKKEIAAYEKRHYQENRGKRLACVRAYYQTNKEKCLTRVKKYREDHKEEISNYKKEQWNKNHFGGNRDRAMIIDNGQCGFLCGKKAALVHHLDGDPDNNKLKNLIAGCRSCHALVHNECECILRGKNAI